MFTTPHWRLAVQVLIRVPGLEAVDSGATVELITRTLSTMATDKNIGRSEALRRSMVTLIELGAPYQGHPAYWAPFVVVGEGAVGLVATPSASPAGPSVPTTAALPASAVPLTPTKPVTVQPSTMPTAKKATRRSRPKTKEGDWKTTILGW
jgi:CHAT domain